MLKIFYYKGIYLNSEFWYLNWTFTTFCPNAGYGLFTTKSFTKGDFLLEYRGKRSCVDDDEEEDEERGMETYVYYYTHDRHTYRYI